MKFLKYFQFKRHSELYCSGTALFDVTFSPSTFLFWSVCSVSCAVFFFYCCRRCASSITVNCLHTRFHCICLSLFWKHFLKHFARFISYIIHPLIVYCSPWIGICRACLYVYMFTCANCVFMWASRMQYWRLQINCSNPDSRENEEMKKKKTNYERKRKINRWKPVQCSAKN